MFKRFFLFRIAMQNTFKQRLRASLALGSISFSVGVMVVLFGVSAGLHSLVMNTMGGVNVKDVITVNTRGNQNLKLDQNNISKIKSISGVSVVEESVGVNGKINYLGTDLYIPVYAVSDKYFDLAPEPTVAGDLSQLQTGTQNMIISKGVMQAFGTDKSIVGKNIKLSLDFDKSYAAEQKEDTVTLKTISPKVTGMISRASSTVVYVPIDILKQKGLTSVSQLKVRLSTPDKADVVRQNIEEMGFQTSSIQDQIDEVNRIFAVIQKILLVFGFITLAVTIFGTFNTISLTLIEETPQIGFLRIMGMHWRDVGFMFISQAIALTFIGAFIGVIGGILVGEFINGVTKTTTEEETIRQSVYIFQIPLTQIIIMLTLSLILGWLIGLMPARRAVKIGPIEALKM